MNKSSLGFLEKLLKFWFILFYFIFFRFKRVPRPKDLRTAKRVDLEGLFFPGKSSFQPCVQSSMVKKEVRLVLSSHSKVQPDHVSQKIEFYLDFFHCFTH